MDSGALLETYIARGGKDLGEFLVGSDSRASIPSPANKVHLVENFEGVQQQLGVNYAGLCRALEMKGSSLKRMIGNNQIDSGDVVSRCVIQLGLQEGSKQDSMFWYLARGDKTLPSIDHIIASAKKDLTVDGADPQKIARTTALTLFSRSGYTHEKFGALSSHEGMIKELHRNEGYSFSAERAELFAKAILPEQPAQAEALSNILLGLDRKKQVATLIAELKEGKLTFGDLVKKIRTQRHLTQEKFADGFTEFLAKEKCIQPSPTVSQSMIEKWENNKVILQGNAIGDALAKYLRFPPDAYELVPREADKGVPVEDRVKPEIWMERIRGGELTFANYIKTLLHEEGLSFASFGKSISYHTKGVHESFVSGWTKGKRANVDHATALAERAGYTSENDRKDFLAFARTGRLKRSEPIELLDKLLSGEMPLAEFVQQLRTEEGKSPEEMDKMLGLGKGTIRNMEDGRELRTHSADNFADHMPYEGEKKKLFRERLLKKGEMGASATGIDPEGYRNMLDVSMEHSNEQNLKVLRVETSGIRFNHHDPMVERWWRSMAAEHAASDIEKTGHVSSSAVEGWNDLHDLLFATVNPARMQSKTFKNHVELITEFLRDRDDEGTARHAMMATIIRSAADKELEQRDDLAHISGLLNMKFLQHAINIECKKLSTPPDASETWDKVYDSSRRVITEIRITDFTKMDAYFRRLVHNNVIDLLRKKTRQPGNFSLDPQVMETSTHASVAAVDPIQTTAPDILTMLEEAKQQLSEKDRQVLDILLTADPEQKGINQRIATELGIPIGTAGNRLYTLRVALAKIPGLMEALGDVLGSSYVDHIQERRRKSDGEGSGHSGAGGGN